MTFIRNILIAFAASVFAAYFGVLAEHNMGLFFYAMMLFLTPLTILAYIFTYIVMKIFNLK